MSYLSGFGVKGFYEILLKSFLVVRVMPPAKRRASRISRVRFPRSGTFLAHGQLSRGDRRAVSRVCASLAVPEASPAPRDAPRLFLAGSAVVQNAGMTAGYADGRYHPAALLCVPAPSAVP